MATFYFLNNTQKNNNTNTYTYTDKHTYLYYVSLSTHSLIDTKLFLFPEFYE